jgi:hypothetical protein
MGVPATFGAAAATTKDVRVEGTPTTGDLYKDSTQPETLHANPHEMEAPIVFDKAKEGAISFTTRFHGAEEAADDASLATILESAGWQDTQISADTTLDTGSTASSLVFVDDVGAVGAGIIVEMDDGRLIPNVITSYAAQTAGLMVTLPAVPSAGNNVYKAHCLTPGMPTDVTDKSLEISHIVRAGDGGGNVTKDQFLGCALSAVAGIVFEHGAVPNVECTFHTATVAHSNPASLGTDDLNDGEGVRPVVDPIFNLSAAVASGSSAAATTGKMIKATVEIGAKADMVPSVGDSACVGGISGYVSNPDKPMIELEMIWDKTFTDDWDGANTPKFIGITLPSTGVTSPPVSIYLPHAEQMEKPTADRYGESYQKITAKFRGTSQDDSGSGFDANNQPIYLVWKASV